MDNENNKRFWHRLYGHRVGRWGIAILLLYSFFALAAPLLSHYSPVDTDLLSIRQPPSLQHWFGTDELGRDIYSRLLYGGRVSLLVGFASVFLATTIGLCYGLMSGYAGGLLDNLCMRLVDGLLSLPTLVMVIALQSLGNQGLWSVVLVIAFTTWMQTARLIRTEFLVIKQKPFVKAALASGSTQKNVVRRHILPNCLPSLVVLATLNMGHAIITEAALSFLGLGIPPYQPSWGNMLMGGQRSILAGCWWITLFPGLAIVSTVLAVNFVGDAIRDALDPLNQQQRRNSTKTGSDSLDSSKLLGN
ncbi:MAG: ABC transporter permease [Sporomusaceae bacterium]|nr:ABC transporter permease [Sporomusaceae bacterium]